MVKVEPKEGMNYYMDGTLQHQLDKKIIPSVTRKDSDYVMVVDGEEGAGKSVLGMQIGMYLDPTLTLDRICTTADEFIKAVVNSKKNECVIFDEAFTGLSSRTSLSEINNLIISMMMEMRQKNLFVIIILPTYFLLDRYVALFRTKCLFHVYMKKGNRGFFVVFNKKKKKLLYLDKGRKVYSYNGVHASFRGRFLDKYVVDEKEYRHKKMASLKIKERKTKSEIYIHQRNILIKILNKECDFNLKGLTNLLKRYEVPLKQTAIYEIIKEKAENTEK